MKFWTQHHVLYHFVKGEWLLQNVLWIYRWLSRWQKNRGHVVSGRCLWVAPICRRTAFARRKNVNKTQLNEQKLYRLCGSMDISSTWVMKKCCFVLFFSTASLCPMPLIPCLWAQSLVFINSGVKSLASLSPLTTEPTSPWLWPNVTPVAPVASVATSTLPQLMNTQLRKVRASTLDMWEFEQWARESSLESRKWFESQALSNRKSSYSVQEKITTWKKAKTFVVGRD